MFAAGLVYEVSGLLEKYESLSRTASQAVGYREVISHLRENKSLDDTIEQVKIRTRRFARRQETWFRGLSECRPIKMTMETSNAAIAEQIVAS